MIPNRNKIVFFVIISVFSSGFCVTNVPTKTACESYTMSITCPYGHRIEILSANYGRTNSGICPHPNDVHRNCYAKESLELVAEICDGTTHCDIKASNTIFGDPCPGTAKYLFVQYRCVAVYQQEIQEQLQQKIQQQRH